MKELRIRQEVEKEWGKWENVLSDDEVDPLIGLRFKFGNKTFVYGSKRKDL